MDRRRFLRRAGLATAGFVLAGRRPRATLRAAAGDGGPWRTFEITTHVHVHEAAGRTRVWLPTPLADAPYQRTLGDTYQADNGTLVMVERPEDGVDMLMCQWIDEPDPILTLTSRVATTDHAANLAAPTVPPPLTLEAFAPFLRPTPRLPLDGVVKRTADAITHDGATDFEKARAIYDWIVDHAVRDPTVPGIGRGDIRAILEAKSLAGKGADITGLFVGLARAAGLPARVVYGLRVARSSAGLASLGLDSDDATTAQHCRAEVYLTGYGWVPVDPADVLKVMLEEPPGHLSSDDARVRAARDRLFGSWDMNWIAFNFAHDVALPGATGAPLAFFAYPECETDGRRLDPLDPPHFRYEIRVRRTD